MKTKREILKIIIIDVIFVICLILSVMGASYILEDKSSIKKNKDFFTQKEDFDVLFFGSSHSEIFINPMLLWRDYGIVSYNFGNPEEGVPVTYWGMKSAIEVHKPKVIVFDVTMINRGESYSDEEHVHYALDSYPFSKIKIDAANDLLTDTNEKLELFFKLGNYHSRWKDINVVNDPFVKGSLSYGEYHTMRVTSFEQYGITDEIADIDERNRDLLYIRKIIELCKNNDIDLVLTANPFQCPEERQADINSVEMLANQNGVPFLNFIKMNNVIDFDVDLYDCEHVNQSGLNKMCDYWGSYLSNNFALPDRRDEEEYSSWKIVYEEFKQLKYESMWWIVDDIEVLLQALHDKDIKSYVYIGGNSNISIDGEHFKRLLQNIVRTNITISSEKDAKSYEMFPLELLDETYKSNEYGLLTLEGKMIRECQGEEALKQLRDLYSDIEVTESDIVIVIADAETGDIKMVRKYTDSPDNYDNIFLNIPQVYFE